MKGQTRVNTRPLERGRAGNARYVHMNSMMERSLPCSQWLRYRSQGRFRRGGPRILWSLKTGITSLEYARYPTPAGISNSYNTPCSTLHGSRAMEPWRHLQDGAHCAAPRILWAGLLPSLGHRLF